MVGAIALTHRQRGGTRGQTIAAQNRRRPWRRRGWSIRASGREWTCDVAAHPQPVRIERSRDAHRSYMPSLRLDFARHERNSKDRNRRWAVISVGHYLAVSAVLFTLGVRSEEHTSELPSLMSISYAVFFLTKK